MATHSSIVAWKIPRTEEPAGHSPWGHKESDTTERLCLLASQFNCLSAFYLKYFYLFRIRCTFRNSVKIVMLNILENMSH